jgi:hypothetical protein
LIFQEEEAGLRSLSDVSTIVVLLDTEGKSAGTGN